MSAAQLRLIESPMTEPAQASATPEWVIETDNLVLQYGPKRALDGLSLRIPRGRIHAIVGANGAGKSSLFRILLGFQSSTAGEARILGQPCEQLGVRDRARIGFVNEEHSLPAWLRVHELIAMQRRLYADAWNEQELAHLLGHFNVDRQQRIRQLSRGERAGLNLALAMAQSPELLILDEPTLGLDVVAKRAFLEALLGAAAQGHRTIIYCSHQMEEVERLADNLIVLERGRLIHMSAPDEFCQRVSLWVVDFGLQPPDLSDMPGLLQLQRLDGLCHLLLLDRDDAVGDQLQQRGARRCYRGAVSLDRAVNALLTRDHPKPL